MVCHSSPEVAGPGSAMAGGCVQVHSVGVQQIGGGDVTSGFTGLHWKISLTGEPRTLRTGYPGQRKYLQSTASEQKE